MTPKQKLKKIIKQIDKILIYNTLPFYFDFTDEYIIIPLDTTVLSVTTIININEILKEHNIEFFSIECSLVNHTLEMSFENFLTYEPSNIRTKQAKKSRKLS